MSVIEKNNQINIAGYIDRSSREYLVRGNALFENKINNSINLRERIIEVLSEKECSLKELIAKVTQNRSIIDYLLNKQVFYCYLESIDREKSIEFQKKGKKTLMKL